MKEYTLTKVLGEGGFGIVFSATKLDKTVVALKFTSPEYMSSVDLFVGQTVQHRNITPYTRVFMVDSKEAWVSPALDYFKNKGDVPSELMVIETPMALSDLSDFLEKYSTLNIQSRLQILYQISLGLSELHRHGLLHLDMKPENVLVFRDEDGFAFKITDYGLASFSTPSDARYSVGTPFFMPPESWCSFLKFDHQTIAHDVWAFAIMCLAMFGNSDKLEMTNLTRDGRRSFNMFKTFGKPNRNWRQMFCSHEPSDIQIMEREGVTLRDWSVPRSLLDGIPSILIDPLVQMLSYGPFSRCVGYLHWLRKMHKNQPSRSVRFPAVTVHSIMNLAVCWVWDGSTPERVAIETARLIAQNMYAQQSSDKKSVSSAIRIANSIVIKNLPADVMEQWPLTNVKFWEECTNLLPIGKSDSELQYSPNKSLLYKNVARLDPLRLDHKTIASKSKRNENTRDVFKNDTGEPITFKRRERMRPVRIRRPTPLRGH